MIDRSSLHFCLRPGVLLGAGAFSAGLFALLPLVALLCLIGGSVAFLGCWLLVLLMIVISYGAAIAGGLGVIGGFFALSDGSDEAPALIGGGVILAGLGIFCCWLFDGHYAPIRAASFSSWGACFAAARFLWQDVFVAGRVHIWSWSVLAVALLSAAGVLLAVGALWCEAPVKYTVLKIGYTCPRCRRQGVPLFRCPACRALVDGLRSSVWGVWKASCASCGEALLTTDLSGRLALYEKVCRNPTCSADLTDTALGRTPEFHLAVVGATSSGKSNLLLAALWRLKEEFGPANGLSVEFGSERESAFYREGVLGLKTGQVLPKTQPGAPQAFNVTLRGENGQAARLYLYDPAGEDFQVGDARLSEHTYHRLLDGLLFVIDPFAEPEARRELTGERREAVNPATAEATDVLGRLIPFLESSLHVSGQGKFGVPLAVVVSKMDAWSERPWPELPDLAGTYTGPGEAAAAAEGLSPQVRHFLAQRGLGNFVGNLEARFHRVAYFAASALGRPAEPLSAEAFSPRGVLAPLIWLGYHSRALPGGGGVAWVAQNLLAYYSRSLRGLEGKASWWASWVLAVGLCVVLLTALGSLVGLRWGLGLTGVGLAGRLGWSRYRVQGTGDLVALRGRLAEGRRAYLRWLSGERGQRARWLALAALPGALVLVWALWAWWWPLGLLACGVVVACVLGSLDGRRL